MPRRRFALFDFMPATPRNWIIRWREVLIGVAIVLLGLWWWANTYAVVSWLSAVIILLGAALIWTGVQRLRFRQGGGGAGRGHLFRGTGA
jgi:hypothetical protein